MKPYRIMMFIVLLALLWQPTKSDAQSGCDVADVAWHPTEDLIAFNCHEIINIYTVQFALVKALIPPPEPANTLPVAIALEWSPNGSYFAAIISRFDAPGGDGQDSRLVVWDTNTWAIILDIPDRGAPIAWSPDSSIVATDSLFALDAVYFYAIPTGIELGRCDDCSGALDIAWNPTDLHQFIASFSSMTFFVDPVALGTPPTIVEGISLVGDGYSPDGARIVFYNRDAGRIEVQDAYTRQVLATLSFDLTGPINSYHWLSDGIYIDNGNSVTVRWDGLSQQTDILPEGHYWNPDGSVYFSSNRTGAFIHDTLTGEIKAQFVLDATSQVSSFSLFDVNTGETISDYTPLTNGTTINAEQIGATNLGFRVITNPSTVGSVIFDLNGATAVQIDNTAPYDFTNWTPTAGTYSLIATPYSEADGAGTAGLPMTVTFTLISSSASCDTTIAAGDTSGLISAIVTANGNGAPDTICLTQSTYTVTAVNNTTDGPNGLPSTATDITIVGNGATIMRDPAAAAFRIFHVAAGGSLTLDGVTISGGSAMSAAPGNDGGAIYNRGTVNLTGNTSITNSTANADGGAVYNRGTFTVGVGSTISSNTAADDGGGVYTSSGTLNVTGGTITDNTAADEGGGIRSVDSTITLIGANITDNTATGGSGGGLYTTSTTLTVTNGVFSGNGGNSGGGLYFTNSPSAASLDGVQILNNTGTNGGGLYLTSSGQAALTSVTVSGNQATSSAAGIWSGGTLTLTGSTISNNGNTSQPGSAGGIRAAGATLTVNDTVISGNLAEAPSDNLFLCTFEGNDPDPTLRDHQNVVIRSAQHGSHIATFNLFDEKGDGVRPEIRTATGNLRLNGGPMLDIDPQIFYQRFIDPDATDQSHLIVNIDDLQTGDYVFVERSFATVAGHGYLIAGWGQIMSCPSALSKIWTFEAPLTSQYKQLYPNFDSAPTNVVPYVVDFPGSVDSDKQTQRPRPRPFYCATYIDPATNLDPEVSKFQTTDDGFAFFSFPNSLTINADQLYVSPQWHWSP